MSKRDDLEAVLYQERPGNLRFWLGVPLFCVAAYFGWELWRLFPLDRGEAVAFAVLLPLFSGCAVIVGSVSISKRLYHSVTLTPTLLRVGRHTLPLQAIDAEALGALTTARPGAAKRLATSVGTNDFPETRAEDPLGTRLMGGAWGVPMGMDSVLIPLRDGGRRIVATMNRPALLGALSTAVRSAGR